MSGRSPVPAHGPWPEGAGSPPGGEIPSLEVMLLAVVVEVMLNVVVLKGEGWEWDGVLRWCSGRSSASSTP